MSDKTAPRPWGAHISIAGGVERAPARAEAIGASAMQIFTKNNNRWNGPPISAKSADGFKEQSKRLGAKAVAAHDCYLINLASPDKTLAAKSLAAFIDEIQRADLLGIPYLVFHPGSHMGEGESDGIKRVAESLQKAMEATPESETILTLETTAGQGTSLGYKFDHLAQIIELSGQGDRMGVCVDTCHIFAAGFGLSDKKSYQATFAAFQSELGLENIKLFHINDSKKPQGSRVDRHEHIGQGHIGKEGFSLLVNDRRFFKIPMILETPKGPDGKDDILNLGLLGRLAGLKIDEKIPLRP